MAQDPYGYPEAVPGQEMDAATTSLWTGIGALVLGAISPCCCYISWLPALPLSVYALWKGSKATNAANGHERTAATAGMVSASIALVFSLIFLSIWVFYGLYFLFVIGLVAAGEM